ncbi:MAG TPA: hypothetical protein VHL11_10340, partial [Phototrophicaceae bacterium]|nr:hypothetical protein [Phototrophicaceae bacterium]
MPKTTLLLLLVLCLGLGFQNTLISAQDNETCPGLPPSRLIIGDLGVVLPGAANNLRAEPDETSELLTTIASDYVFDVMDGPECTAEFAWWQVAYDGYVGWTVENVKDEYAVEPVETTQTDVNFGGVAFNLDSRLFSTETGQVIPGSDPSVTDQPFWLQTPPFINFAPDGDFDNPGTQASIAVYPAKPLGDVQQTMELVNLQNLLENPPENFTPPMLPILGMERVLFSQVEPLDFKGGSGVRFVAYFSQSADPLTSGSLSYVFQGLTRQGELYVQVYLPLTTDLFPSILDADFDYDSFIADYDTYLSTSQKIVDKAVAEDFVPNLKVLDQLVMSLDVDPEGVAATLNGDNSLTARCEVTAIADTRLRTLPDVNSDLSDYLP